MTMPFHSANVRRISMAKGNLLMGALEERAEIEARMRKPYTPPKLILELELETRAGSPLGLPDPFDPLGQGLPDPDELR